MNIFVGRGFIHEFAKHELKWLRNLCENSQFFVGRCFSHDKKGEASIGFSRWRHEIQVRTQTL
jgi:hypothetical protein